MEPDIDKIVSNKIRQIEQRPVSWNKQAVWQNVQARTTTTQRPYFLYSATAAMILLLVYFALKIIPDDAKPQVTNTRINPKQEATQSAASVIPAKPNEHAASPLIHDRETPGTGQVAKVPKKTMKVIKPSAPKIENVDSVPLPLVTDVESPNEEPRLPAMTVNEQKIRPVVGIIVDPYPKNFASAKRKKQLRKLKSSDPMPWDPGNALVFFVKK